MWVIPVWGAVSNLRWNLELSQENGKTDFIEKQYDSTFALFLTSRCPDYEAAIPHRTGAVWPAHVIYMMLLKMRCIGAEVFTMNFRVWDQMWIQRKHIKELMQHRRKTRIV